MANEIPSEFNLGITGILSPPNASTLKVLPNFVLAYTKKGADETCAVGEPAPWPDSGQPAKSASAQKSLDNRLCVVVFMMTGSNARTAVLLGNLRQSLNPPFSTGSF